MQSWLLETDRIPRRAFLAMPVAFAALVALFRRPGRAAPDVREEGAGREISIVLFDNTGRRGETIRTRKLVKTDAEWKKRLWSEEYLIARQGGTELAYTGRYWNDHTAKLFRCACCGNAVFRGQEKFDSETGWPSFLSPAASENLWTREDRGLAAIRTEALCMKCDAHLGHVFNDGPAPTGMRWCINSAALSAPGA